ncbi:MAG: N-acetylmuramoyl-L-alanine amidase [Azoarcus sp.]|jgi:N-acetylmuramoyl-L-alanine amidase|nr:N-acetylmuramoyl-L-alanine amidase [Azoarcus sp.]
MPPFRRLLRRYLPPALCLMAGACATLPAGDPAAQWRPSPNHGVRKANYVVLHHTSSNSMERALSVLTSPLSGVSSHYLVDRNGAVLQLVDENRRAWHAGESYWGGQTDMNSASIGIELVNNGREPFPPAQIDALLALLAGIQSRHHIPRANFLGHADVAPGRKADPSAFFPWRRLAAAGFGLWCEPPYAPPPEGFDALSGLAALGYDTRVPYKAIAAFRLHFSSARTEDDAEMSATEREILYCLLQRAMRPERE